MLRHTQAIEALHARTRAHGLCHDVRMVEPPRGVHQTGRDIVGFQVGKVLEDLLLRLARGQQLQNVDHANTHLTNAGAAPTLFGTDRDALEELNGGHRREEDYRLGDRALGLAAERDRDVFADGGGNSREHAQGMTLVVGVFEAGDHGLGRTDARGQRFLRESVSLTKVADGL